MPILRWLFSKDWTFECFLYQLSMCSQGWIWKLILLSTRSYWSIVLITLPTRILLQYRFRQLRKSSMLTSFKSRLRVLNSQKLSSMSFWHYMLSWAWFGISKDSLKMHSYLQQEAKWRIQNFWTWLLSFQEFEFRRRTWFLLQVVWIGKHYFCVKKNLDWENVSIWNHISHKWRFKRTYDRYLMYQSSNDNKTIWSSDEDGSRIKLHLWVLRRS